MNGEDPGGGRTCRYPQDRLLMDHIRNSTKEGSLSPTSLDTACLRLLTIVTLAIDHHIVRNTKEIKKKTGDQIKISGYELHNGHIDVWNRGRYSHCDIIDSERPRIAYSATSAARHNPIKTLLRLHAH